MNTDSREYDILKNAVIATKDVEGLTCEIGVREGGGTKLILDTSKEIGKNTVHICIDPFGNIDYEHYENQKVKLDYTNSMKNKMLMELYSYCHNNQMECLFFPLEDTEFFKKYSDGVPIYNEYKQLVNKYSVVFLDGPHTTTLVKKEFDFFKDRISVGGTIIFDDIDQYPHMDNLDQYIKSNGFDLLEAGVCKISYIKKS